MLTHAPVDVMLPVVDLATAKAFYAETLGLNEFELPRPEMAEMVAVFATGSGNIVLYRREEPTRADHTAATFHVDDLESLVTSLAERGVVFEKYDMPGMQTDEHGITSWGDDKGAWFKDPAGNILGLQQFG